ncbi:MAG TPA: PDZ domain-containing protein [Clostridia bacterium]|nr:PDZ domain-containing protein [Clostridia bacterium]
MHLFAGISALVVWSCVVANAGISTPVAEVIPDPSSLGPGWESQIEVLVDSETTPFQMLVPGEFAEATVNEWRRSAADPSESLSGWGRARFDFKWHTATNRYYLQVDRFRSQAALADRWARLAETKRARHNTFPQDIGEAACVTREAGSVAVWFRRGSFIVNVSSSGATPPEDPGGSMQRLAREVDDNISEPIGTPGLIILARKGNGAPLRTAGVVPGSPADEAGMGPDGFLIAVDGTNVVNMSLREAISRVRGTVGTVVTLDVADSRMAHTNRFTVKRGKLAHSKDKLEMIKK